MGWIRIASLGYVLKGPEAKSALPMKMKNPKTKESTSHGQDRGTARYIRNCYSSTFSYIQTIEIEDHVDFNPELYLRKPAWSHICPTHQHKILKTDSILHHISKITRNHHDDA